jgi:transposase-like protein
MDATEPHLDASGDRRLSSKDILTTALGDDNFHCMSPPRTNDEFATAEKVEAVLRLLGGDGIAEVARQTGRPERQLAVWRDRFLAGGEAGLTARLDPHELERLRLAQRDLSAQVADLEAENRSLARQLARADRAPAGQVASHPYCSERYARALEEPGVSAQHVPEWDTYVLVRNGRSGTRQAVGIRPLATLDPACDLRAGLETLRRAGVTSVSLVTDPLSSPERAHLEQVFDTCHVFKENYVVDRELRVHISKRHRNRINKARRGAEIREIELADYLPRWFELYEHNVANRQIPQPFLPSYYEGVAGLPGLRTVAVTVDQEVVTITIWVRHGDTLYFLDGASSAEGLAAGASYVAFAHIVESWDDCPCIFLGGAADYYDDRLDGLARFKRGFSNGSAINYLCGALLGPPTDATGA